LSGVLLLDKHAGQSSNGALGWAKRLFNAAKAGHTGTLDPFATGLLPVCFGEAAKFARFHLDADKGYRATLKLGERTSTGDTEGGIVETREVSTGTGEIDAVLATFVGRQMQTPPMHSAIKQDGVALYKLARQGLEVERQPREIEIKTLSRIAWTPPFLVIDTRVSKGTYIRVLAEDIGAALGCGAHLCALRRTGTGNFTVDAAIELAVIEAIAEGERDRLLLPCDSLAMALPRLDFPAERAWALANGQRLPRLESESSSPMVRAYGESGQFLGVAALAPEANAWVAERMMGGADQAERVEKH
jgi:tRNA pseudouridine55 synthase